MEAQGEITIDLPAGTESCITEEGSQLYREPAVFGALPILIIPRDHHLPQSSVGCVLPTTSAAGYVVQAPKNVQVPYPLSATCNDDADMGQCHVIHLHNEVKSEVKTTTSPTKGDIFMLNEWQLQEHSTDPLGSSVASAVAVEHQRTNIELKTYSCPVTCVDQVQTSRGLMGAFESAPSRISGITPGNAVESSGEGEKVCYSSSQVERKPDIASYGQSDSWPWSGERSSQASASYQRGPSTVTFAPPHHIEDGRGTVKSYPGSMYSRDNVRLLHQIPIQVQAGYMPAGPFPTGVVYKNTATLHAPSVPVSRPSDTTTSNERKLKTGIKVTLKHNTEKRKRETSPQNRQQKVIMDGSNEDDVSITKVEYIPDLRVPCEDSKLDVLQSAVLQYDTDKGSLHGPGGSPRREPLIDVCNDIKPTTTKTAITQNDPEERSQPSHTRHSERPTESRHLITSVNTQVSSSLSESHGSSICRVSSLTSDSSVIGDRGYPKPSPDERPRALTGDGREISGRWKGDIPEPPDQEETYKDPLYVPCDSPRSEPWLDVSDDIKPTPTKTAITQNDLRERSQSAHTRHSERPTESRHLISSVNTQASSSLSESHGSSICRVSSLTSDSYVIGDRGYPKSSPEQRPGALTGVGSEISQNPQTRRKPSSPCFPAQLSARNDRPKLDALQSAILQHEADKGSLYGPCDSPRDSEPWLDVYDDINPTVTKTAITENDLRERSEPAHTMNSERPAESQHQISSVNMLEPPSSSGGHESNKCRASSVSADDTIVDDRAHPTPSSEHVPGALIQEDVQMDKSLDSQTSRNDVAPSSSGQPRARNNIVSSTTSVAEDVQKEIKQTATKSTHSAVKCKVLKVVLSKAEILADGKCKIVSKVKKHQSGNGKKTHKHKPPSSVLTLKGQGGIQTDVASRPKKLPKANHPRITWEEVIRSDRTSVLILAEEIIRSRKQWLSGKEGVEIERKLKTPYEFLPKLPPNIKPNGYDHMGRPWTYIDCPNGTRGVYSRHRWSRVSVATLVRNDAEPWYFPSATDFMEYLRKISSARHIKYPITDGKINPNMDMKKIEEKYRPAGYPKSNCMATLSWSGYCERNDTRQNMPIMAGDQRTQPPQGQPFRAPSHKTFPKAYSSRARSPMPYKKARHLDFPQRKHPGSYAPHRYDRPTCPTPEPYGQFGRSHFTPTHGYNDQHHTPGRSGVQSNQTRNSPRRKHPTQNTNWGTGGGQQSRSRADEKYPTPKARVHSSKTRGEEPRKRPMKNTSKSTSVQPGARSNNAWNDGEKHLGPGGKKWIENYLQMSVRLEEKARRERDAILSSAAPNTAGRSMDQATFNDMLQRGLEAIAEKEGVSVKFPSDVTMEKDKE